MTTTKSDVAWLIEKVQAARAGGPEYWSVTDHDEDQNLYGWATDPNGAMRFDNQTTAQDYIDVHAIEDAEAIEHAWV